MKKQTSNIQNKPTRYIKIPLETWRKLDNLKLKNETWDDLLNRLCHYASAKEINNDHGSRFEKLVYIPSTKG